MQQEKTSCSFVSQQTICVPWRSNRVRPRRATSITTPFLLFSFKYTRFCLSTHDPRRTIHMSTTLSTWLHRKLAIDRLYLRLLRIFDADTQNESNQLSQFPMHYWNSYIFLAPCKETREIIDSTTLTVNCKSSADNPRNPEFPTFRHQVKGFI